MAAQRKGFASDLPLGPTSIRAAWPVVSVNTVLALAVPDTNVIEAGWKLQIAFCGIPAHEN